MHKVWYFFVFIALSHCATTISWLCLAHIRHLINSCSMNEWTVSTEKSHSSGSAVMACMPKGGGVHSARHNEDTLLKNSKFRNTLCTKTAQRTFFLSYIGRGNHQIRDNKNKWFSGNCSFPACKLPANVTWTELEVPPSFTFHGVVSVWREQALQSGLEVVPAGRPMTHFFTANWLHFK